MTTKTSATDAQTIRSSRLIGRRPVAWLMRHEDHITDPNDPRGWMCLTGDGQLLLARPEGAVDPLSPDCPPELRAVIAEYRQRESTAATDAGPLTSE
jgi:hypothetical protein